MAYWKRYLKPGVIRPWNRQAVKFRNRDGETMVGIVNVNPHRIKRYDLEKGHIDKVRAEAYRRLSEKEAA